MEGSKRLKFNEFPKAQEKREEFYAHLKSQSSQAATGFLAALEETYLLIHQFPEIFSKVTGETRMAFHRKFPNHLILYRLTENSVDVFLILHTSRDYARVLKKGVSMLE